MAVAAAAAPATAAAAAGAALFSQVVAAPQLEGWSQPSVRSFLEKYDLYCLTCSMSNVRQSQLWQLLAPALLDAVPSLAASKLRVVLPPFRDVVGEGGALLAPWQAALMQCLQLLATSRDTVAEVQLSVDAALGLLKAGLQWDSSHEWDH
jgi:hypothetical protein